MLAFLEVVAARRNRERLNLLSPVYMCHEVIAALRQHGVNVSYFAQPDDLACDTAEIRARCESGAIDVLLVSHLYGRRVPLAPLRRLCDELNIVLLEDSAHLPWCVIEDEPMLADAQVYSHRKLFALPYGASIRVGAVWTSAFDGHCRSRIAWRTQPAAGAALAKWLTRESAKAAVMGLGLPWRRRYVPLGIDPLKPYNDVPLLLRRALEHLGTRGFVDNRRRNYEQLRRGFAALGTDWQILDCTGGRDVPYQFLVYRTQRSELVPLLERFLERGISAVQGLELLPETRAQLGPDHPFNNQIGLPVHQDITPAQIDFMLDACRAILR